MNFETCEAAVEDWLKDGVYWTEVDEAIVFLDIVRNQYLVMPDTTALEMRTPINVETSADPMVSKLRRAKLLRKRRGRAPDQCNLPSVRNSLLESREPAADDCTFVTPEIRRAAFLTNVHLILTGPYSALRKASVAKRLHCYPPNITSDEICAAAVAEYRRLQPFTFGTGPCLHESLTLQRVLSRGAIESTLVFGVRHDTMNFHCWIQIGSVVINDSLVRATSYEPLAAFSSCLPKE